MSASGLIQSTVGDAVKSLGSFLGGAFQYAYVANDLDEALAHFSHEFGTGAFDVKRSLTVDSVEVDGAPADEWMIDVATINILDRNLEVIQPISGAVDLYRRLLRPGRVATFHHLGVEVADLDEVAHAVTAAGRTFALRGEMVNFCRFAYLDTTADLGHYLEYIELADLGRQHFAALRAAAQRISREEPR